jgi:ABC-2 type transport system ATP-binding protein
VLCLVDLSRYTLRAVERTLLLSDLILSTSNLRKKFSSTVAVADLSLQIRKGDVWGLLGPNGSGKTTTLGMLLGVIRPTSGDFSWFDQGRKDRLRKRIGALLERPRFYPWMTGRENLKLTASIKGVSFAEITTAIGAVGLDPYLKKKVGQYSLGMKQRLGIASCLLGEPDVLVLDEPTNGMDPQGIADIRDLILSEKAKGRTIILASHILDEVEKVCSHVLILKTGQVLASGSLAEVMGASSWFYLSATSNSELAAVLNKHPNLREMMIEGDQVKAQFQNDIGGDEVNRFCFDHNICLRSLELRSTSLEENFLQKLKESGGGL